MLYKQKTTRPLPAAATVTDGMAKWKGHGGKTKTAPVVETESGEVRIVQESNTWYARFLDADRRLVARSTGCTSKAAAEQRLATWLRERELVRGGVVSTGELEIGRTRTGDIGGLVSAHFEHLRAKGCTPAHCKERTRYLTAIIKWTGAGSLHDLSIEKAEAFLLHLADTGRSARTRNQYRTALVAFGTWMEQRGMIEVNPYRRLPAANEQAARVHVRRALTEPEIEAILAAAKTHYVRNAEKAHKGKGVAKLKPETKDRLLFKGEGRVLALRVMLETAIRLNEAKTLTIGSADLESKPATITLEAKNAKNRRRAVLPLRDDLADHLRDHLEERLRRAQEGDGPAPLRLAGTDPLLPEVPTLRGFKDDMLEAGLAKTKDNGQVDTADEHGRVIDLHALRGTAITRWAKSGVPLVVAQRLARHSDPRLTSNHYTTLGLVDLHSAVESAPAINHPKQEKGVTKGVTKK